MQRAVEDEAPGRNPAAHGVNGGWRLQVAINRIRDRVEPFAAMRFLREQRREIDAAKAGIDDGGCGIDRSQLRLQLRGHLWRALDNGVTRDEITEVVTHLAFYVGWPNAGSAALVVKQVFEERPA